ncbi:hypothetical protein PR202_gb15414 [Eleusine coracana subsp. coracana]|uniref:Uncharacterized protein n=1 Tax=Eleusine coracana subsp. coracana TaxID=191504 RepID=A0AAV5EXV0_ELECO|nr:hypothetical protein PR202_gb15414 [Eleusine coracana subsp. coracana]
MPARGGGLLLPGHRSEPPCRHRQLILIIPLPLLATGCGWLMHIPHATVAGIGFTPRLFLVSPMFSGTRLDIDLVTMGSRKVDPYGIKSARSGCIGDAELMTLEHVAETNTRTSDKYDEWTDM